MTLGDTVGLDQIPEEIKSPDFYQELASEKEDENYTDLKQIAEAAERKAILSVLGKTGFNKSKTAKILKVDRKTLYNKIAAYNIELPE
jgi:two-component system response regulator HydG